jgi:hypothetical protein
LAVSVAEASSQGVVILLLCAIILMEYPRRGTFFGFGDSTSRYTLPPTPINLLKKYHGYFFSYAVLFDFWFHPAEPGAIFAFGFAHTTMIMMQGSLSFTLAHKNVYWRFVLETWVVIHGTVVAVSARQGNLWRMFFFGFSCVMVSTQIHGLPFFQNHPHWVVRITPFVMWLSAVLAVYGSAKDWVGLNEVIRIPLFLYGFCYALWITNRMALAVQKKLPSVRFPRVALLGGFLSVFVGITLINVAFKTYFVQMELLTMAAVLIGIYCVFIPFAFLFIKASLMK